MTTATASSTLLAASAVLLGLTLIVPQAFAVEEMRQFNKDDTKTGTKEQLMGIAQRCGGPCDDYQLLVKAIVDHVAGEANVEW